MSVEFSKKLIIRKWLRRIVYGLLLSLVILTVVAQPYMINSNSMDPTVKVGDCVLVMKFIYGFRIPFASLRIFDLDEPKRGHVIVFSHPADPQRNVIKRVIAMGGDEVNVAGKKVYVNGRAIPDPPGVYQEESIFAPHVKVDSSGSIFVPPRCLFVLGDNRDSSSYSSGLIPIEKVKGKVFILGGA